eukprot:TRINITY_DN11934_c0_g1_i1.p1 TRINITY_DN11934_c0_g1~~TRINITY_DN11934_c0_g1_i1.p1  ORF type:complete len:477 (+),score=42.62 TRINITY_DN11934_c0_g1_i1:56-1486(+)
MSKRPVETEFSLEPACKRAKINPKNHQELSRYLSPLFEEHIDTIQDYIKSEVANGSSEFKSLQTIIRSISSVIRYFELFSFDELLPDLQRDIITFLDHKTRLKFAQTSKRWYFFVRNLFPLHLVRRDIGASENPFRFLDNIFQPKYVTSMTLNSRSRTNNRPIFLDEFDVVPNLTELELSGFWLDGSHHCNNATSLSKLSFGLIGGREVLPCMITDIPSTITHLNFKTDIFPTAADLTSLPFQNLRSLTLQDQQGHTDIRNWAPSLPHLTKLKMVRPLNLRICPEEISCFTSLTNLVLFFETREILVATLVPTTVTKLKISGVSLKFEGLECLTSLHELEIHSPSLGRLFHPPTQLTSLSLLDLSDRALIDRTEWEPAQMPKLKKLRLEQHRKNNVLVIKPCVMPAWLDELEVDHSLLWFVRSPDSLICRYSARHKRWFINLAEGRARDPNFKLELMRDSSYELLSLLNSKTAKFL